MSSVQIRQVAAYIQTIAEPEMVGSMVEPEHLTTFIAEPHQTKPGTNMPSLWGISVSLERKQSAEAIVHYLTSLKE